MIPLTPDTETMPRYMPAEHCCFCGAPSRLWYAPKDVAVCEPCALVHTPEEVPTKNAWCDSPQGQGRIRLTPGERHGEFAKADTRENADAKGA